MIHRECWYCLPTPHRTRLLPLLQAEWSFYNFFSYLSLDSVRSLWYIVPRRIVAGFYPGYSSA